MRNRKPAVYRPAHARTQAEADQARAAAWKRKHDAEQEAARGTAAARGYDRDWLKLRARFKAANPFCVECLGHGLRTPTHTVDHIRTVRERPDLRLEWSNLQALCRPHHAAKTNRKDGGWGNPRRT